MSKLDPITLRLITIFQQEYRCFPAELDPVKYVKKEPRAIAEANQLFEYLGLATFDRKSPLGWRPTQRMIKLIEEKAGHSATYPAKYDEGLDDSALSFIPWLLPDQVFGRHCPPCTGQLGFCVLRVLGLTRDDDIGGQVATPELVGLFIEGYYRQPTRANAR